MMSAKKHTRFFVPQVFCLSFWCRFSVEVVCTEPWPFENNNVFISKKDSSLILEDQGCHTVSGLSAKLKTRSWKLLHQLKPWKRTERDKQLEGQGHVLATTHISAPCFRATSDRKPLQTWCLAMTCRESGDTNWHSTLRVKR